MYSFENINKCKCNLRTLFRLVTVVSNVGCSGVLDHGKRATYFWTVVK